VKDSARPAENLRVMAARESLDFHGLALERVQLDRCEAELAQDLERARRRAGAFPSEFATNELRRLMHEHGKVLDSLAELSGLMLLIPLRRAL
jgi:hypothetical protein